MSCAGALRIFGEVRKGLWGAFARADGWSGEEEEEQSREEDREGQLRHGLSELADLDLPLDSQDPPALPRPADQPEEGRQEEDVRRYHDHPRDYDVTFHGAPTSALRTEAFLRFGKPFCASTRCATGSTVSSLSLTGRNQHFGVL